MIKGAKKGDKTLKEKSEKLSNKAKKFILCLNCGNKFTSVFDPKALWNNHKPKCKKCGYREHGIEIVVPANVQAKLK